MRRKLKGFTLVELLAAMAIIAILIGLAGFGITIALRNSRDTQRKAKVNDMQVVINDYYTRQSAYPTVAVKSGNNIVFQVGGAQVGDTVTTKGATVPLTSGTNSTTSGTLYRYGPTATGYYLCAKLENGDWFDLSTSGLTDCSTNAAAIAIQ